MRCHICAHEISGQEARCPQCRTLMFLPAGFQQVAVTSEAEKVQQRYSSLFPVLLILAAAVAVFLLMLVVRPNFFGKTNASVSLRSEKLKTSSQPVTSPEVASGAAPLADRVSRPDRSVQTATPPSPSRTPVAKTAQAEADKPDSASSSPATVLSPPAEASAAKSVKPVALPPDSLAAASKEKVAPSAPDSVGTPSAESETAAVVSVEPPDQTLTKNTALVTIGSYTRARVYIDGQYSGMTPRTVKLLSGSHTITLLADGYEEWTKTIRLSGKQQTGVMAAMTKKNVPPLQ